SSTVQADRGPTKAGVPRQSELSIGWRWNRSDTHAPAHHTVHRRPKGGSRNGSRLERERTDSSESAQISRDRRIQIRLGIQKSLPSEAPLGSHTALGAPLAFPFIAAIPCVPSLTVSALVSTATTALVKVVSALVSMSALGILSITSSRRRSKCNRGPSVEHLISRLMPRFARRFAETRAAISVS